MKKSTKPKTNEKSETAQSVRQPSLLLVEASSTSPTDTRWALDEQTRDTGRKGLAKARAALQATRPAHLDAAA